jgi:hypothetical protein
LLVASAELRGLMQRYIADAKELGDAVNLASQPSSTEPLDADHAQCLHDSVGQQTAAMDVAIGDLTAAQAAVQDSFVVGPQP